MRRLSLLAVVVIGLMAVALTYYSRAVGADVTPSPTYTPGDTSTTPNSRTATIQAVLPYQDVDEHQLVTDLQTYKGKRVRVQGIITTIVRSSVLIMEMQSATQISGDQAAVSTSASTASWHPGDYITVTGTANSAQITDGKGNVGAVPGLTDAEIQAAEPQYRTVGAQELMAHANDYKGGLVKFYGKVSSSLDTIGLEMYLIDGANDKAGVGPVAVGLLAPIGVDIPTGTYATVYAMAFGTLSGESEPVFALAKVYVNGVRIQSSANLTAALAISPTATIGITATPSDTVTPSATETLTDTITATATKTPTATLTNVPCRTTAIPSPTLTPSNTPSATKTPTITPTVSRTPTATRTATATARPCDTVTPTPNASEKTDQAQATRDAHAVNLTGTAENVQATWTARADNLTGTAEQVQITRTAISDNATGTAVEIQATWTQRAVNYQDTLTAIGPAQPTYVPQSTSAGQPIVAAPPATAAGPSGNPLALCKDGTYSYAAQHRGACAGHGGVAVFYR